MSNGNDPQLPSSAAIIQGAIQQQQQAAMQANAELEATLTEMRNRIFGDEAVAPVVPAPVQDEQTAARYVLLNSSWTSEVVFAAVLDDTFREQTQERAREILREHGMLPAEPEQPSG